MADEWDPLADPADAGASEAATNGAAAAVPGKALWYSSKPVVSRRPLRVACLHGTSSCPQILKMQLGRLTVVSQGKLQFIYIPGQLEPTEDDAKSPAIQQMQSMFPGAQLRSYASYVKTPPLPTGELLDYQGLEETIAYLQTQLQEHAPIDGVLGFSQGGNMASILAGQAVTGQGVPLTFVVHMSSTEPGWAHRYPEFFTAPLRIPSFHLWGNNDPNVGTLCPENLPQYYCNPEVAQHSGDHRPLPRDREEADALASKLLTFMERAAMEA